MESQNQVAEISPPVDCNHRISQLYCHHRCTKNAQICEMRCPTRANHDVPLNVHQKATVKQMKLAFSNLEEPCERETQNSVRQINEIEIKAHETIAQKKRQCLNQIEALKKAIMMKTYKELESQLPHLYEKCKNDRFDALNCKEVFWVMKSNRSVPNLKHSQIDSKLLSIIRKFQNFKDVSKNIKPADVIFNKEKAKAVKILEKMPEYEIKVKQQNITLERPDYSEDRLEKYTKQLEELSVKRKELEKSIKLMSGQKARLAEQVNNLLYTTRQKIEKPRLKLVSQAINIRIPFQIALPRCNFQQTRPLDKPVANEQQRQQVGSNWNVPKIPFPASQQNEGNNSSSKEEHLRKIILHEPQNAVIEPQHDKAEDNVGHESQQQNQEASEAQRVPQQNQEEKIEQKRLENIQVMNEQQERIDNPAENHQIQQVIFPRPHDSLDQRLPEQEPRVKVQFDEHEGFEPWRNKELLEQMKKFGRSEPQCLKVENIDILKSFSTIRLNPPKSKINPLFKNFSVSKKNPPAQSPFAIFAMHLFNQEIKRKTENKDKDKTLEKN